MVETQDGPSIEEIEDELVFPQANIAAVRGIAGALETALGPLSRDKLLVKKASKTKESDHALVNAIDDLTVSSDGATILDQLPLEHPVAPIVRRIAGPERPGETGTEGEDVADGVTSAILLATALLEEAESLIEQGLHPTEIQMGYAVGLDVTRNTIERLRAPAENREDKLAVARTTLTGNNLAGAKTKWAEVSVEAAETIGDPTSETLAVEGIRTGFIGQSQLVRGAVLTKSERSNHDMPKRVEDARVLVLGGQDDGGLRKPDVDDMDATFLPSSAGQVSEFSTVPDGERYRLIDRMDTMGVDVVVARQGIDSTYRKLLAERGIIGIRGVQRLNLAQVARATGARTVLKSDDFTEEDLGYAGVVEERIVGKKRRRRKNNRILVFDECKSPESVAVLLMGVQDRLAEEAAIQFRKATKAVAIAAGEGQFQYGVLPGGGATEVQIARDVDRRGRGLDDRPHLAAEAYAGAVRRLVGRLAKNAGLNPLSTVPDLRAAHEEGQMAGFVFPQGTIEDPRHAGVLDPAGFREPVFTSAVEVANLLLGIDDALDAIFNETPTGPDEAIYDEPAERHQEYLKENETPQWG